MFIDTIIIRDYQKYEKVYIEYINMKTFLLPAKEYHVPVPIAQQAGTGKHDGGKKGKGRGRGKERERKRERGNERERKRESM